MEKKKNIIYITGKDNHKADEETGRFMRAFRERQDANSIDIYAIEEVKNWWAVSQDMQTIGLFVEKRLFVFTGSLKKESSRSAEVSKAEKKSSIAESELLKICENISDDTFLIFSGVTMNEKSPLKTWLESNADVRKYDAIWDTSSWESRFPSLESWVIHEVLRKYRQSLERDDARESQISYSIGQSFEKLSLLRETRALTPSDIEGSLFLDASPKMYDLSDAILRSDSSQALKIFHTILESMNVHAFLASFIWLIRPSIYVKCLKHLWKSQKDIATVITLHPYVIQKAYESRIPYRQLSIFYGKILSLNIAYRSGKWLKDPELWRIFDIELAIMGLKK
jgi:DNA polymerase III delta subunit